MKMTMMIQMMTMTPRWIHWMIRSSVRDENKSETTNKNKQQR
jgi:hypothetical protein